MATSPSSKSKTTSEEAPPIILPPELKRSELLKRAARPFLVEEVFDPGKTGATFFLHPYSKDFYRQMLRQLSDQDLKKLVHLLPATPLLSFSRSSYAGGACTTTLNSQEAVCFSRLATNSAIRGDKSRRAGSPDRENHWNALLHLHLPEEAKRRRVRNRIYENAFHTIPTEPEVDQVDLRGSVPYTDLKYPPSLTFDEACAAFTRGLLDGDILAGFCPPEKEAELAPVFLGTNLKKTELFNVYRTPERDLVAWTVKVSELKKGQVSVFFRTYWLSKWGTADTHSNPHLGLDHGRLWAKKCLATTTVGGQLTYAGAFKVPISYNGITRVLTLTERTLGPTFNALRQRGMVSFISFAPTGAHPANNDLVEIPEWAIRNLGVSSLSISGLSSADSVPVRPEADKLWINHAILRGRKWGSLPANFPDRYLGLFGFHGQGSSKEELRSPRSTKEYLGPLFLRSWSQDLYRLHIQVLFSEMADGQAAEPIDPAIGKLPETLTIRDPSLFLPNKEEAHLVPIHFDISTGDVSRAHRWEAIPTAAMPLLRQIQEDVEGILERGKASKIDEFLKLL